MPTSGILRVGQVDPNTYFVYLTQSGSLTSFNFSTVSAASIYVRKPSGALQTWSCTLSNQTATGLTATRTLQTGDLDEVGAYKGYVLMTVPGGTIRSDTETFYVAEEFAVVAAQDAPSWFISGAVISGGGGSTPTGTGFYGVTAGVMDAAAIKVNLASATYVTGTLAVGNGGTGSTDYRTATETLTNKSIDADANTITNIDNADIKAGAAIAVSKLAPGTDTYVLTTTAGTAVWAAPSGGGSVPTGTGFYTVTGGIMDAAAKSAAAGIYTFLATPSSANLAAAVTDETGSGALVFGTSPTLTTPVISSIVNTGTLTLPISTDTLVGRATTDTLTNKSISGASNTITNVSIATAVSGLGTGVATFLGTPSSANLAAALTDETGTGEAVFSTTPTFKTSIKLNNPGNTFAYTFTPSAIAAARTITLPLLTGNDTMVCEAFTQTLTNKTINGSSNTITNVSLTSGVTGTLPVGNGGTGITSLGTGVATWLGTPSSANLAAAITDETGTGALMFGTAPTVKTTLTIRNPADTFSYTITPSAIAATRTFTLPLLTGNDTFVAEAHSQTLTNKTIAAGSNTITGITNTNVDTLAAIAGTKISPDFGSQNVTTTGYYATGSTVASTGNVRFGNTHKAVFRNAANSADACGVQYGAGDIMYYGLNSGFGEQAYGWIAGATQYMYMAVNSSYYIHLEASEVRMGNPVVGDDTAYASHGAVVSSHTDAAYTVPASEYKYFTITFATTLTADRTMTFPHPSSLARSYRKNIRNSGTGVSITISTGTGTTVQVTNNRGILLEFTNGGVRVAGAEYVL